MVRIHSHPSMGQPTGGLAQRVGRSQFWAHSTGLLSTDTSFSEFQFKILLASRLSVRILQSLPLMKNRSFWVHCSQRSYCFGRSYYAWGLTQGSLPNFQRSYIRSKYYYSRPSRFLLFDGENSFYTIPLKGKRVRYDGIFWTQSRFLRCGNGFILLMRGYNVTERGGRLPREKRVDILRSLPWILQRRLDNVDSLKWF